MEADELQHLQQLVYEYYRIWQDHYGSDKDLPPAFHNVVDLLEKHSGHFFNTDSWQWKRIDE